MASFLAAVDGSCQSPAHKRGRSDQSDKPAGAPPPESKHRSSGRPEVSALSNLDLTRGYLDHDAQLRQLHASCTLVFKYDIQCVFSELMLGAVRTWQEKHRPGALTLWGEDMSVIAREISLCAARPSSKKTHLILEFRPHLASVLIPALPVIAVLLEARGGERLDVRPQGSLARKAKGL
ncbi:unnamed protein product [Symbiodinium sp. CCMP2592]|nr:unnamed protein product [Symbiodinium sp. CCMP2592]